MSKARTGPPPDSILISTTPPTSTLSRPKLAEIEALLELAAKSAGDCGVWWQSGFGDCGAGGVQNDAAFADRQIGFRINRSGQIE